MSANTTDLGDARSSRTRLLGWAFVVVGLAGVVYSAHSLVTAIVRLTLNGAARDPITWAAMREGIVNGLPSQSAILLLELATVTAGVGLLARRRWALPWVACISVVTVARFVVFSIPGFGSYLVWVPRSLHDAPVLTTVLLLNLAGMPVVAVLALASIHSLPVGRPVDWLVAVTVLLGLHGFVRFENWRAKQRIQAWRDRPGSWERSVQPGKGRLVIVPTVAGEALGDGPFPVRVLLSEIKTHRDREVETRCADGEIDLPDVDTGLYIVSFSIDANPRNGRDMPGDYIAAPRTSGFAQANVNAFRVDLVEAGATVRREMPLLQIMGLVRPDALAQPAEANTSPPALHSPVTFQWDSVPAAATYMYAVIDVGSGGAREVTREEGPATTWTVTLPPSDPQGYYMIHVVAYDSAHTEVGHVDRPVHFEVRD